MEGAIGDILNIDFEWMLDTSHGADYFRRWHRKLENSGGLLVHKATHHFDIINWLIEQDPETVYANGTLHFYGKDRQPHGERCCTCSQKDICPYVFKEADFWGSEWVGFAHFAQFFSSPFFPRLIRNTILISIYGLLWGFPIPILFALFLNELKPGIFKKTVQTVSYMPHFISTVVLVGIVQSFLSPYEGIVNNMITALGSDSINFLAEPSWFRTIYIGSGIWQIFGYNYIIYLSAISAVDPQLYESFSLKHVQAHLLLQTSTSPLVEAERSQLFFFSADIRLKERHTRFTRMFASCWHYQEWLYFPWMLLDKVNALNTWMQTLGSCVFLVLLQNTTIPESPAGFLATALHDTF